MPNTISNGFDLTRIFAAFKGRLGWHQPTFGGAPTLDANNLRATSGRYYDRGFHKASTIKNYWSSLEEPNPGNPAFNQLLQDEDEAVITRCLNAVFNRPQLIEHVTNYTRTANIRNVIIPNQGNVCGYRFNIAPGDFAVAMDSVGLFFDKDVTFNLYAYNDLKLPPVYTQEVSATANTQTVVQLDSWVFNYLNTAANGRNMGGVWYICYFQKDLGGAQAIDEQLNLWADSKIFGAYPFQSPAIGDDNFNRINPSVNFRSYGLNVEVSSYRDYTQMIVQNPGVFDEARGLLMSINVLEQLKFTTATNATQRNTTDFARNIDLDMNISSGQNDQYPSASGLKQQLQREFVKLNRNFWPKMEAVSVPVGNANWAAERYYEGMDINALPSRENAY